MSSSSPSMSAMEIEESSDTSREDRNNKSRHNRPASVHQTKSRQLVRNFAHPPPSPVGSLSYGGLPAGVYIGGSPYSTAVTDHLASGSVPAYSMWGSDSSQLYRPGSGDKEKDKKQVCSTLLIATAALVVMAVLAIAAIAAYLGVMTNHSDGDKYEIQFDCSLRIIRGDNFRSVLADPANPQFRTKSDRYRRLIDNVYKASPLSDAFRRCSVERFTNGSLVVHFQLFFDRRKIPAQIGETESSVQDVMVQEVMAVEPVAFKSVVVDIDSIKVQRYIPSPASLLSNQRSRLQIEESIDDENSEDDGEKENTLEKDGVQPVLTDDTFINQPSSTEVPLPTTDADVSDDLDSNNMERTTISVLMETSTTTAPPKVETSKPTTSSTAVSTQDPRLTYDDSEWKPIFVNTRPNHGGSVTRAPSSAIAPHINSPTLMTPSKHLPTLEDNAGTDEDGLSHHTHGDETSDYEGVEEGHSGTSDQLPNIKLDRVIETGTADEDKGIERGVEKTPQEEATPPPNKFSFLQWFNAQLNSVKSAQNRPHINTTTPALPSGPTLSTRFYTFKPTAVSYSGVQPILRPKPWENNSTDSAGPDSGNEENHSPVDRTTNDQPLGLPRPFLVQTTLTLGRDPTKLIESPRSQKSLSFLERVPLHLPKGIVPRELQQERQQQVESLKDFFPPVRRPVPRPLVTKSEPAQQDGIFASLPIEGLFTTLKPQGSQVNSDKQRSHTNSPIYTFKLNQGQTVHDVLSQLLADLTVGDSPAQVEIDGTTPHLTLAQQQQQKENADTNIKASNKKIDDDRLKPWTHTPFRPTVLNALVHGIRDNTTNNTNGSVIHNVAINTSSTTGSVKPTTDREDIIVTTDLVSTGAPTNFSNNGYATSWLEDSNSDCEDQFRCHNGECVSGLARCNQMSDCRDGSDELNCTCADFLRAQFLSRKICDGIVDCWDYSDENQCEWCRPGQYICPNSKVCIDRNLVCNGIRDCPNGDDERHCIALAHHLDSTEEMSYSNSGYLMVRREGRWGKLCMQNFETAVEKLRQSFQVNDLGKAVCRELTFTGLEKAEKKVDSSRSNQESVYYELIESGADNIDYDNVEGQQTFQHALDGDDEMLIESPRASMLDYTASKCSKRQVIHVQCRDLECGVRPQLSSTRARRIVGGANSTPGAWPWQAALYKEGDFQCGATLISSQWLVSAGHCFYHAQDDHWVARLGALRRGSNLLSPHEQVRVISHIFIHPSYIDTGFVNDISILRMEEPVRFTDYIRPICLPPPTADIRDGRLCTVVGWGQLYETGRVFPDTLQQVQLPLVSTEECRKRTLFLPLYRLTNNMFCAGFDRGGRDACLGDSGGPLMCEETDGRWTLQGVTSNGYGCARANRPGVYTKVARYVTWIDQVVNGTYRNSRRPSQCNNGHRCLLGQCLPKSHVCNGIVECSDGSDERSCSSINL